jgi:hypothetical protein
MASSRHVGFPSIDPGQAAVARGASGVVTEIAVYCPKACRPGRDVDKTLRDQVGAKV